MDRPNKVNYDDFLKTITMFCIDDDLEANIEDEISKEVMSLSSKLSHIGTKEGLESYIRSDDDSLSKILSLLGVSEEKFKRIISLLRRERRYSFNTEWSLSKTRQTMLDQASFMDDVCELLMDGAHSDKFKGKIPNFYLSSFKIDQATMSRLINLDDLRRLVKQQLDVKYNNNAAKSVCRKIENTIELFCEESGYTFEKNPYIPALGYAYRYAIPNSNKPRVIIDYSYNVTTASTQSALSKKVAITKENIASSNMKTVSVVVLEGAGWFGRQSDLRKIHTQSDYLLNISYIENIKSIIDFAMED